MKFEVNARIDVHHHHHDTIAIGEEMLNKLDQLLILGRRLMASQAELTAQVKAATEKLTKIGTETGILLTKIEELKAIIETGPVNPELHAAVEALAVQAQVVDDLVPDPVTP